MLTSCRAIIFLFASVLIGIALFSQEQPKPAPVNPAIHVSPPAPDPLELATVATEVPNTPEARSAVLKLLERARQNADIRSTGAPPFHMRMSFNASGDVLYTGSGETEDTWVSWESSRWSAHLGDFSMTRIWDHGASFDDKPVSLIPMRLHMLRDAVFWPLRARPNAHLRTASANWQGRPVICILTSGAGIQAQEIVGRRWVEREYCIEPTTGRLQVLSDAPGMYVIYDYTGAVDFHGHSFPRQITIFEGGRNVLQAHVDELSEARNIPAGLLTPTRDMVEHGPVLSGPERGPRLVPVAPGAAMMQPVIVHIVYSLATGKVLDAELVQDSGAELEKSALELVRRLTYPGGRGQALHDIQTEAFINVKFVSK